MTQPGGEDTSVQGRARLGTLALATSTAGSAIARSLHGGSSLSARSEKVLCDLVVACQRLQAGRPRIGGLMTFLDEYRALIAPLDWQLMLALSASINVPAPGWFVITDPDGAAEFSQVLLRVAAQFSAAQPGAQCHIADTEDWRP